MTQDQRLYEYLKENSGITTLEAMSYLGISRLSNVIHDLKSQGIQIVSSYTEYSCGMVPPFQNAGYRRSRKVVPAFRLFA